MTRAAAVAGAALLALIVLIAATLTALGGALSTAADTLTSCVRTLAPGPLARRGVTSEMLRNAHTIVEVGRRMHIPRRGMIVATATALQESGLRNLHRGDRDSLGLFQQRPSQGWGSPTQILNPAHAARSFYTHLSTVDGWVSMSITGAAQAVQHSAFGDAYQKWQPLATDIVGRVLHLCDTTATASSAAGAAIVQAARTQLGVPYVFAGGNAHGPTTGTTPGIGFDCSGLTLYALARVGVRLPHSSEQQYTLGTRIPAAHAQPGDLVFFHTEGPPGDASHVGIYLGNKRMIDAPDIGQTITTDRITDPYWRTRLLGFRRMAA